MGMISLKRGPGTKVPYSFTNSGVKGKGKGISRSGKVLRIEPGSRKVFQVFPPLSPVRKPQQKHLRKVFAKGPR